MEDLERERQEQPQHSRTEARQQDNQQRKLSPGHPYVWLERQDALTPLPQGHRAGLDSGEQPSEKSSNSTAALEHSVAD